MQICGGDILIRGSNRIKVAKWAHALHVVKAEGGHLCIKLKERKQCSVAEAHRSRGWRLHVRLVGRWRSGIHLWTWNFEASVRRQKEDVEKVARKYLRVQKSGLCWRRYPWVTGTLAVLNQWDLQGCGCSERNKRIKYWSRGHSHVKGLGEEEKEPAEETEKKKASKWEENQEKKLSQFRVYQGRGTDQLRQMLLIGQIRWTGDWLWSLAAWCH